MEGMTGGWAGQEVVVDKPLHLRKGYPPLSHPRAELKIIRVKSATESMKKTRRNGKYCLKKPGVKSEYKSIISQATGTAPYIINGAISSNSTLMH